MRAAQDSARKAAEQASADSVRNELAQARIDSIYRARQADTLKAPFAHFERPDQPELTDRLRFTREQILSSGAINLADLLDRVPGITTFRTRWLTGLHVAALNGDFRRIRVFLDGDRARSDRGTQGRRARPCGHPALESRRGRHRTRAGRSARLAARVDRARKTTPYTRVDIFTGDLNTNGFRGLFARRFANGFVAPVRRAAGRDADGARVGVPHRRRNRRVGRRRPAGDRRAHGWARGKLTIDAQATGIARTRDSQPAREGYTNLVSFKGSRREGYGRIAYGDSTRGFWTQALVGVLRTRLQGDASADTVTADTTGAEPASRDTVRARTQQLFTVGYRAPWWHASLVDRVRPVEGTSYHAPAFRAGLGRERFTLMAYGERRSLDSLSQLDMSALVRPLPWLSLVASQSWRSPINDTTRTSSSSTRVEAAVRFRRLWFGGGVMREGATQYASFAPIWRTAGRAANAIATTGVVASVRRTALQGPAPRHAGDPVGRRAVRSPAHGGAHRAGARELLAARVSRRDSSASTRASCTMCAIPVPFYWRIVAGLAHRESR